MCPQTTRSVRTRVCVSSCYYTRNTSCGRTRVYRIINNNVSAYNHICVLIQPHTCPHATIHVSSHYYICDLILLHTCPHTTTYVTSYYYICVLILLYLWHLCPHTCSPKRRYIRVLILLHTCPHTTYVSSYYYIRDLILLHMCPHTTISVASVSSYLLAEEEVYTCPHTLTYVSSHYYILILILQCMCPYSTICVLILARRRGGIAGGIVKYIVV